MKDNFFVDSNICLYLLSNDLVKKDIAKEILLQDAVISTQVISENINVVYKKLKHLPFTEIDDHINLLRKNANVVLIELPTIDKALIIKERYQLQWYDSLIVAAAILANCTILYSEDMQHGFVVDGTLTIINPFV
jgi:predicted nucleic acid-binding protein